MLHGLNVRAIAHDVECYTDLAIDEVDPGEDPEDMDLVPGIKGGEIVDHDAAARWIFEQLTGEERAQLEDEFLEMD